MMRVRQAGFTLIEVLIALAVFGVLATMAQMMLAQTLNNSEMLTERMDRLQSIQRTVGYLSTDFLQAAPRPVRADLGQFEPALRSSFGSDFALELTRGGWPNSLNDPLRRQRENAKQDKCYGDLRELGRCEDCL